MTFKGIIDFFVTVSLFIILFKYLATLISYCLKKNIDANLCSNSDGNWGKRRIALQEFLEIILLECLQPFEFIAIIVLLIAVLSGELI
jgi:hypothetical protein